MLRAIVVVLIVGVVRGLAPAKLARAWLRAEEPGVAAKWYEERIAGVSTRDAAEDSTDVLFGEFALRYSATAPSEPYSAEAMGFLGIGVELPEPAACEFGVLEELAVAASLVPDEPPEKKTTLRFATSGDPAGYPVFAVTGTNDQPASPKLVLCVSDLNDSVEFYTRCLGMRLLRRRSLVPGAAAMVAILGYTDADEATLARSPEGSDPSAAPRLELRYVYGNENVKPKSGLAELVVEAADPDALAGMADLYGGTLLEEQPTDDILVHDPDGYTIRLCATPADS
mmetsp:Transcript_16081/g.50402  ORF Transcript_16081/g.50402 Transcript_16081/m.50402 type:complete len:284 (-) Transcript_16081:171-1022(-)